MKVFERAEEFLRGQDPEAIERTTVNAELFESAHSRSDVFVAGITEGDKEKIRSSLWEQRQEAYRDIVAVGLVGLINEEGMGTAQLIEKMKKLKKLVLEGWEEKEGYSTKRISDVGDVKVLMGALDFLLPVYVEGDELDLINSYHPGPEGAQKRLGDDTDGLVVSSIIIDRILSGEINERGVGGVS